MKKFLMMAAMLASALVFAEETATSAATASTLYWSVDENSLYYANAFTAVLIGKDGAVTAAQKDASSQKFANEIVYSFNGSTSDWFYLELLNESGETLSVSDTYSYSSLLANGYVDAFPTDPKQPDTLHSQMIALNASHVPEPSSGLLLALGLAGLALKRKRRA